MAKLYITEYFSHGQAQVAGGVAQAPMESPLAEQVIDYSGGHAESAAFNALTTLVRIHTDAICSVLFGTAPDATTGSARMAANQTEYRAVTKGGKFKVSAVSNT